MTRPVPPRRTDPAASVAGAAMLVSAAIVVAGLWLAQEVLVPLVLAGLLAFVLAPAAGWLRRLGLGDSAASGMAVVLALLAVVGLGFALAFQLAELVADLPRLADALREKLAGLSGIGDALRRFEGLVEGIEGDVEAAVPAAPPAARPRSTTLDLARAVLGPVLHPLAVAGLVAFFATLVLLFRRDLRDRAIRLAGASDLHRTVAAMDDAAERLSKLFSAQAALNAGYGIAVGLGLWAAGLPSPLLWGLLAGLMRFVPFVGTPIAVLPPTVLALAADPGWGFAAMVFAGLMLSELFMGQVAEPLVFGKRTGLSPLSIILSASFWTLLWGPIGLLIATPLTVGLVVLGRHVPQLEFLDVLLGDRPALRPEESFYQLAMAGDADALVAQAAAAQGGVAGWGDAVALRGLVLAQGDWSREAFEPERLETIRAAAATALEELEERPAAEPGPARAADWAAAGAVLCVPGRGALDDVAARVAALALRRAGFGAEIAGPAALDAANLDRLDGARVRLVVLSLLEEGNSVAGARTFLRRLARALPQARVVVGLWRAAPESAMLAALREEGPAEAIVTSAGEVVAACEAISGRVVVA